MGEWLIADISFAGVHLQMWMLIVTVFCRLVALRLDTAAIASSALSKVYWHLSSSKRIPLDPNAAPSSVGLQPATMPLSLGERDEKALQSRRRSVRSATQEDRKAEALDCSTNSAKEQKRLRGSTSI
jgi:hypothetical protein